MSPAPPRPLNAQLTQRSTFWLHYGWRRINLPCVEGPSTSRLTADGRSAAVPVPDEAARIAEREAIRRLWSGYKDTGDRHLRDQLIVRYSPLVKYVAAD